MYHGILMQIVSCHIHIMDNTLRQFNLEVYIFINKINLHGKNINFAISRHHMFYSFHISFASPFTSWTLSASIGKAMPANIQKYHTDKVQSIVSTKSNQHHLFVFRGIIKLETHVSYDDLIKVQLHV